MLSEGDLIEETRDYWAKLKHNPDERTRVIEECYIPKLLRDEMAYARQQSEEEDEPKRLPEETCDLLILLVGFSEEPLLQTVCAYRPSRILLILNQWYGDVSGEDYGNTLADLITQLQLPDAPKRADIEQDVLAAATPADVFQMLLGHVRTDSDIIIDVTGAKKSMVTGAFLFAAFADVPVSYVDFDDDAYDSVERRPYGYKCQIGLLGNPYEKFALRDWEQVREQYEKHKFQEVRLLLEGEAGIRSTMKEYLSDSISAVDTLIDIVRCYEAWAGGDHNRAARIANTDTIAGFTPPAAVSVLGGNWVEIEGGEYRFPREFYVDEQMVQTYVADELAKIRRLIDYNEDYRSAFLRCGSLNEVILNWRMIVAADSSQRKQVIEKMFDRSIRNKGAKTLFKQLVGGTLSDWAGFSFTAPGPMNKWWLHVPDNIFAEEDGWTQFLSRRNEIAHTFAPVPEKWARDALAFVSANAGDLWGALNIETEAMSWPDICSLCGLDEYLPINLRRSRETEE